MRNLITALLLGLTVAPWVTARLVAQDTDSILTARFQVADSFIRAAQYERAIQILEQLKEEVPATDRLYHKLRATYEAVKRYEDALALVDEAIQRAPAQDMPALLSEKARLHFLRGDEGAAEALWEESLTRSFGTELDYRTVYNSMVQVRLLERAIAVLKRGRSEIGDPSLFQSDLAYLYGHVGDHEQAMEEFLGLLATNERQLSYVRNRLGRIFEQEGALAASVAVAERAVALDPAVRSYRELLGWIYLEAGDYAKAYAEYGAVDRLGEERGRAVFDFAERAADAAAYDIALQAYEEVLQYDTAAPTAADALLGLAKMHRLWAQTNQESAYDDRDNRQAAPHYDTALESLRRFLQRFPGDSRGANVLQQMAAMERDVFIDLDQASSTLHEVIQRFPDTESAMQAQLDVGRIAVLRGQLEEAHRIFGRLADTLLLGELAEEARYEQALVHLYRGEIAQASALFNILDENTSIDVANDALSLRVLLLENTGPDSTNAALRAYAHLLLMQRQRRAVDVVPRADSLAQAFGGHPIADEIRFLRALALREVGRASDAHVAFSEIALMYPASPLVEQSLFLAAEILQMDLAEPEAAAAAYTDILRVHPGSLLAPEVRRRIRILRAEGV